MRVTDISDTSRQTLRPLRATGLAVYLTPRMLLLAWLGMVSGLPLALTASTLTAWLADSGITFEKIGLFALVGIPYTFKFLWAPLMDGLSPPLARLLGRRRAWMVWCLLALACSIFALSLMNVDHDLKLIALFTLLLAFSSASFDINMDALRIEWLPDSEQGAGAAMAVFGYRIGMIISSAGALYIAAYANWPLAYQIMGAVVLLGAVPTLLAARTPLPLGEEAFSANEESAKKAGEGGLSQHENPHPCPLPNGEGVKAWLLTYVVTPFREFSQRPNWWRILLFILLFKLGDAVLGFMTMPFLISEAGYTKDDIALVVKIYGLIATMLGTFVAGLAIMRFGVFRCLVAGGILQSAANLPYVYLATLEAPDNLALGFTIAIDNAFGGFATIAFIAYISVLCNKQFTVTQYALLTSLASVGRVVVSAGSGVMAAFMGWPLFFVFTAVLGLPALFILWLLSRSPSLRAQRSNPAQ